jgi:hypothetical protein
MNSKTHRLAVWLLVAAVFIGIVGCAIHIWGGIFYLNPIWYYVPPISALLLLAVVTRPRTMLTGVTAYMLAGLFVASYAIANWRWVEQRIQDEGWFFFPDGAEALLVLTLLIASHFGREGKSKIRE